MTATSPDLLSALPGLVAARIHLALPALRDCKGMVGRFDLEQLKSRGVAAPAVLVSRLSLRQDQVLAGPHVLFQVRFAAFIVTKDELGLPRDAAAARIAQVLLRLIPNQIWGLPADLDGAFDAAEEPLITAASEKSAISLSAVTWTQGVALAGLPEGAAITPELYVGQAPLTGPENIGSYTQIGGAP
jgi:hypothetical protein